MAGKKSKQNKKNQSKNRVKLGVTVGVFLLVFVEIIILVSGGKFSPVVSKNLIGKNIKFEEISEYAIEIVEYCKDASYKPTCYDEEIPKLMDFISMEDAFEVTREIQNQDEEYLYCHVLGHELSAIEARKDIENWKDVIGRCPSGLCSNGCLHGAFQERFRTESLPDAEIDELKAELEGICEPRDDWDPTGLEQGSCYHALGHLTMYITDADNDKSIALCDELAVVGERDYRHLCYDGLFMQVQQPLDPEDFALVEGKQPTKEEIPEYCSPYIDRPQVYGSCWSEAWPLFFDDMKTPEGLTKFCSNVTDEGERTRCYTASFYVLTPQFDFDVDRVAAYCTQLSMPYKAQCFANAASRMIETDYRNVEKSAGVCEWAEEIGVGDVCYEELLLYSTYNFHPGSEAFMSMCNGLPSEWKDKCLAGDGR